MKGCENISKPISKESKTLRTWVDENHKILTLLGIFTALNAFFNNLYASSKTFSMLFLSFVTFLMFLVFCIEIWISFPRREETFSKRLIVFETLFVIFLISVMFYFFDTYKEIIKKFIFFFFVPIYAIVLTRIIEKTRIHVSIRKMRGKKKENITSYVFSLLVNIIILILSLLTQELVITILSYLGY